MHFNNILVVIDPENQKQAALERALHLIKQQNSSQPVTLTAFLAIYNLSYAVSVTHSSAEREEMIAAIIEDKKVWLNELLKSYSLEGIQLKIQIVWESNEADAIEKEIVKHHHDLVVKFTHQEDDLSALIFTPTDWQLLRKSSCPILMVKDGDWQHQRRILVAVNVSDDEPYHDAFNKQLVGLSMSLAQSLDRGNIHLVTAYPTAPVGITMDLPEFSVPDYGNSIRGQHLINMKALRQHFGIDEDHTHVYEGLPEEVIPKVAQDIGAELVVLGTIGRTGLSAVLLGNTAEHVISHLNCNLLAIKPAKNIPPEA
ncbi:universal stress protein UspE [Gallibacterium salpingitidis]|uniref:Universal stress protein UspE n=1 Tax=Gallibacterium salpingitidis TaxID=505341 RepID=A0A1A7NME4_9PAST|nr:universal stress protein UspE [Gallibacterium salpingitidis]OBW90701.1 universal stress protein UspE [Gallibacterium salpingitidis]